MKRCETLLKHKHLNESGFTLAELIVASMLISIVMGGVYTALSVSLISWRVGEANYQVYEDARLSLGLIRRELAGIPDQGKGWFSGKEDELEFFTISAPMEVETGETPILLKVTYEVRRNVLTRVERVVEKALPPAPSCKGVQGGKSPTLGSRETFELAANVKSLDITYTWQAPAERKNHPNEQPRPTKFIVQDENPQCWGLPIRVDITLELTGEKDTPDEDQIYTFNDSITFSRGGASPSLPEPLREEWQSGGLR